MSEPERLPHGAAPTSAAGMKTSSAVGAPNAPGARTIAGLPPTPPSADEPLCAPPDARARILILLSSNPQDHQVEAALARAGFEVASAPSAEDASSLLTPGAFDAALLDLATADRGGFALLPRLRALAPNLPVITIVGAAEPAAAWRGLRLGAADFVVSPVQAHDLPAIFQRNLPPAGAETLQSSSEAALDTLLSALSARDSEPAGHPERVTAYAIMLADAVQVGDEERYDIERGALLHDIGKIGIPDRILLKPGPLTPEEWAEVRQHPAIGFQMCRRVESLRGAAQVILHHHERWDGAGYPDCLRGEMIPLGARIFAVADAFDAMTTDRPYRRAVPYPIAQQEMVRQSGAQFDPAVVRAFLAIPPARWEQVRQSAGDA